VQKGSSYSTVTRPRNKPLWLSILYGSSTSLLGTSGEEGSLKKRSFFHFTTLEKTPVFQDCITVISKRRDVPLYSYNIVYLPVPQPFPRLTGCNTSGCLQTNRTVHTNEREEHVQRVSCCFQEHGISASMLSNLQDN